MSKYDWKKKIYGNVFQNNGLIASSVAYMLSNILCAFVSVVALPIYARHLSIDQLGVIAIYQTSVAALNAISGLGITGALTRKFYDAQISKKEMEIFIGTALMLLICSAIIIVVLLSINVFNFSNILGIPNSWLVWAEINVFSVLIIQIRLSQWQIRKKYSKYCFVQISQNLITAVLGVISVIFISDTAEYPIIAQVGVSVSFCVALFISMKMDKLIQFAWRTVYIKELLGFGFPLVPHTVGYFVLNSFDRYIINSKLGLYELGIYSIAAQLSNILGILLISINSAYVPWLYEALKRDNESEKQKIVRYTYYWFSALLITVPVAFFVSKISVILFAGDKFIQAADILGWLVLAQVFNGMYLVVTNYIFYSKRTNLLMFVTIGSAILDIVLLTILISAFGLVGAAISSALAMGIRFAFTWWVAGIAHPMPWINRS